MNAITNNINILLLRYHIHVVNANICVKMYEYHLVFFHPLGITITFF